jgi:signal recognition particle subunit SEC65
MGKKAGGVRVKQLGSKQPPPMINPMDAFQIPPDEMVQLPPLPDRSYQVIWPIHESFTMKMEGFQVIYPSYLDSSKSVGEGRRISQAKALPCPTVMDMSQSLQMMHVRHAIQPYKGYSRDITCQWDNPGRILVDVSRYRKKELLLEMVARIGDLPARQDRLAQEAIQNMVEKQAAAERRAAALASTKTTNAPKKIAPGANNKKKKGKKK